LLLLLLLLSLSSSLLLFSVAFAQVICPKGSVESLSNMAAPCNSAHAAFEAELLQFNIEERFHALLAELCNGECGYLSDIEAEDLIGRKDANGSAIAAPVARGLIRKLRHQKEEESSVTDPVTDAASPSVQVATPSGSAGSCELSLWRDTIEAPSLIRCELTAQASLTAAGVRRKVLTAILDRSGSMTRHWKLLVEAVARVITDELLADPLTLINVVVYDGEAMTVPLPRSSQELRSKLLYDFAPNRGITCFGAAYAAAEAAIRGSVNTICASGSCAGEVDILTLLFTDGQDTSQPPRGAPSAASAAAARTAGDKFKVALKDMGCAAYTLIAAFGEAHSPELCQYLSDRYVYINRAEVLSDWLAGGLNEMLSSGGQCVLGIFADRGLAAAESEQVTLPMNPDGSVHHHFWIRASADCPDSATVAVDVNVASLPPMRSEIPLRDCVSLAATSFEHNFFILDRAALQLRQLAQMLSGRRPTEAEIDQIRSTLVDVKGRVAKIREDACSVHGLSRGRAALRLRAQEVESLRDRLSYAVGHFDVRDQDTRAMGSVAIDAVLRAAGQQEPFRNELLDALRHAKAILALPAPEALSQHGKDFAVDMYSGRDAQAAAQDGDALFFQLHEVQFSKEGIVASVADGVFLVTHENFLILSENGSQAVAREGMSRFTHVGLPLYATQAHFHRVRHALPSVLRRLVPNVTKYDRPEKTLLAVFGHSLATARAARSAHGAASRNQLSWSLLHKVRALHAVMSTTASSTHGNLLAELSAECESLLADPSGLRNTKDLFTVAAMILLLDWPSENLVRFSRAVAHEALQRNLAEAMGKRSEIDRLWLGWALIGTSSGGDNWIEELQSRHPLSTPMVLGGQGYNPLTAASEIEVHGTEAATVAPRASGLAALRAIFSQASLAGVPSLSDCESILQVVVAWNHLRQQHLNLDHLWEHLDAIMVLDAVGNDRVDSAAELTVQVETFATQLPTMSSAPVLRTVVGDPHEFLLKMVHGGVLQRSCKVDLGNVIASVTEATRALVSRRIELVHRYPIQGATPPNALGKQRIREVWGDAAKPCDEALYLQAKRDVSAWHRGPAGRVSMKMARVDKRYRALGGTFEFQCPFDTFIEGLHQRTQDLHTEWATNTRLKDKDAYANSRDKAVQEMLLRLRWDDRNVRARAKLELIIANIWDGLSGMQTKPVSSALWLSDEDSVADSEWTVVSNSGAGMPDC